MGKLKDWQTNIAQIVLFPNIFQFPVEQLNPIWIPNSFLANAAKSTKYINSAMESNTAEISQTAIGHRYSAKTSTPILLRLVFLKIAAKMI